MNPNLVIPIISKIIGKDISQEIDLFYRGRAAIGKTLSDPDKEFFIRNWPTIITYMESLEGSLALSAFLDKWKNSLVSPPEIAEDAVNDNGT